MRGSALGHRIDAVLPHAARDAVIEAMVAFEDSARASVSHAAIIAAHLWGRHVHILEMLGQQGVDFGAGEVVEFNARRESVTCRAERGAI